MMQQSIGHASRMLRCLQRADLKGLPTRPGETRLWEAVRYLDGEGGHPAAPAQGSPSSLVESLRHAKESLGVRYVLLGIPEDFGPRANHGRPGAHEGWAAFLGSFLKLQANEFLPSSRMLVLGEIDTTAIQETPGSTPEELRVLVSELDHVVAPVVHDIFKAGLEPIVIGGGHNNCYPILMGLQAARGGAPAVAANLDPHADFRSLEGRHSGNGFHYAYADKALKAYHVMGLHEQKNSQAILDSLERAGFTYDTYQAMSVRKEVPFSDALQRARDALESHGLPLGVELDTDSISRMPVSAYTTVGVSVHKAQRFVDFMASSHHAAYLHLCEAAPMQHPQGHAQGMSDAGESLAHLVIAYVNARERVRCRGGEC